MAIGSSLHEIIDRFHKLLKASKEQNLTLNFGAQSKLSKSAAFWGSNPYLTHKFYFQQNVFYMSGT